MEATILLCVIAISLVACDPLHRNFENNRTTGISESNDPVIKVSMDQSVTQIKNAKKVRRIRSIAILYINGKKVCPIGRILIGNECLTCEDIDYEDDRCS